MATRDQAAAQEIVVPDAMLPLQVTGMQAMASKMWMPSKRGIVHTNCSKQLLRQKSYQRNWRNLNRIRPR